MTLLAQARRLSRCPEEARDLLQDCLLVAIEQGRALQRADMAWLYGVMRHQAAMRARGAQRRRRREQAVAAWVDWHAAPADEVGSDVPALPPGFLGGLTAASRQLAVLVLHGLDAEEIRWILGLDPAALRQRLARLRRAVAALPGPEREQVREAFGAERRPVPGLAVGRLRGLLRRALRGPALGSHDPDGHLLVLGHVPAAGGNCMDGRR